MIPKFMLKRKNIPIIISKIPKIIKEVELLPEYSSIRLRTNNSKIPFNIAAILNRTTMATKLPLGLENEIKAVTINKIPIIK